MRFETFLYVGRVPGVNPVALAKQHVDVMRHILKLKLLSVHADCFVAFHALCNDRGGASRNDRRGVLFAVVFQEVLWHVGECLFLKER